jgi:hypothetical protein
VADCTKPWKTACVGGRAEARRRICACPFPAPRLSFPPLIFLLLKYLYLLYAPPETIDLSKVVFNTEAHAIRTTW